MLAGGTAFRPIDPSGIAGGPAQAGLASSA